MAVDRGAMELEGDPRLVGVALGEYLTDGEEVMVVGGAGEVAVAARVVKVEIGRAHV